SQVRPAAREAGDGLLLCLAASLENLASSYLRESESAAEALREAEAAFAELPDERLAERVYLNHYISQAAPPLERAHQALAHLRRGVEVARMTGQDATAGSWFGLGIYGLLLKGEVADAARVAEDSLDSKALERDQWREIWLMAADSLARFWRGGEGALESAR